MTKHIGIVAVSAEGAALCYRTICAEGTSLLGRHAHPEVTMHTYPLSAYMRHIEAGRWDEVGSMLLASAGKVRQAGAGLLICPDNTAHQAIDLIRDQSPAPWLHIAEEVGNVAAERGFRHLLILGTKVLDGRTGVPGEAAATRQRLWSRRHSPLGTIMSISGTWTVLASQRTLSELDTTICARKLARCMHMSSIGAYVRTTSNSSRRWGHGL